MEGLIIVKINIDLHLFNAGWGQFHSVAQPGLGGEVPSLLCL